MQIIMHPVNILPDVVYRIFLLQIVRPAYRLSVVTAAIADIIVYYLPTEYREHIAVARSTNAKYQSIGTKNKK